MANSGAAVAKAFIHADVVKIGDHGAESWLEKQIKADPIKMALKVRRAK